MPSDQLESGVWQYVCLLVGHDWTIEPPWSGYELRHRPRCQRCDHEPENIAITGKWEGEHRA